MNKQRLEKTALLLSFQHENWMNQKRLYPHFLYLKREYFSCAEYGGS